MSPQTLRRESWATQVALESRGDWISQWSLLRPSMGGSEAGVLMPASFDVNFSGLKQPEPPKTRSTFACDFALLRQPGGFEGFAQAVSPCVASTNV